MRILAEVTKVRVLLFILTMLAVAKALNSGIRGLDFLHQSLDSGIGGLDFLHRGFGFLH